MLLEKTVGSWFDLLSALTLREAFATDFAAIRGALMCITGDLQKVTVKMSGTGAGLPAGGARVSSRKSKSGARRRGRSLIEAQIKPIST